MSHAHPHQPGGRPSPQRRSWVVGVVGALVGAALAAIVLFTVLPVMMFLLLAVVGPVFGEDLSEDSGRVQVSADGSVSGSAMARALALLGHADLTCPDVPRVAVDTTLACRTDGGTGDARVVVAFDDTEGRFTTAVIQGD